MPPRPRTPSYFWRRKRTPERLLQPLPALSKKETPTLSLKFWKWPRMPLSQYIAEGPEVPLKARYGKYASSLNPFARHMLARVGHEGRHLSVRHVAPVDDFMAGLTVFTNDAWLNEVLDRIERGFQGRPDVAEAPEHRRPTCAHRMRRRPQPNPWC